MMTGSRHVIAAIVLLATGCGSVTSATTDAVSSTSSTTSPSTTAAGSAESPTGEPAAPEEALSWPLERLHPSLFHDPTSDRLLMFSGMSAMQSRVDMREVWSLDTADFTWSFLGEVTPPDAMINFGLDSESGRVVVLNLVPAETWSYDLASGTWAVADPDEHPETTPENPRFGAPLAYDAESDRLILFGGGSPWYMYGDTWAYDLNTETWEQMSPSLSPSPRAMYATAYDTESDRVLLWGGFTGTDENVVRMWAYDYNTDTWEALENSDGPQQHHERHGLVYLPDIDRVLVYSGMLETGGVLPSETWYYDYNTNTWTEIEVRSSPPALAMYAIAYDPTIEKAVLFGGEMTAKYARNISRDIWVFDPGTEDWAQIPFEATP
jgi:hypothetical protein